MQLSKLDDRTLVSAYIKGDENAFEALLRRHQDRIYNYIFSLVKDHELSNDIFQETFVKAIRTLKGGAYNEEGKFLPWVMRISHNLVMDHFRRNKKMPMWNESSSPNEEFSIFSVLKLEDNSVEQDMVQEEILGDVVKLIDHLPEDQQLVLRKRIYLGMSFKDIAEQEDISINTALGRMRYALINLRKLIEKHDIQITVS